MSSVSQTSRDQKQVGVLVPFVRDLTAVVSLGILLICVHDFASPFVRGFYCDDETIRYPHKESTVSSRLCYLGGFGLNIALIVSFEYFQMIKVARKSNPREQQDGFQTKLYLRNVYCHLLILFFGAIASELITDISKVTAGRLRPHFIDVCKPMVIVNNTFIELDQYCRLPDSKYEYITNYRCSQDVGRRERDTRLSFMSGHSSFSAYSATFAVFYLQSAMDISRSGLMKPAVQVLIISTAFYTGLTRVSDYKHHWQDVLAGLTQGASVAAIVAVHLWPSIRKTYSKCGKITGSRSVNDNHDHELNRVSY